MNDKKDYNPLALDNQLCFALYVCSKEIIRKYGDILEYIERIVPLYPMSVDEIRYKRLIEVLSLYRLTMGQPRQEELLQLLEGKVTKEQMQDLLFDLSPYNHNKKNW